MAQDEQSHDVDALVVGGGPTGLAVCNLLAREGIPTLLIERDEQLPRLPRAVSIDDESMRMLQALGLLGGERPVALPGTGTRYYGAQGQLLFHARGRRPAPYGQPIKNPIDHVEFLSVLLESLRDSSSTEVRFQTALTGIEQEGDSVIASLRGADGGTRSVRARFLLGCDGGRSTVRELIGVPMRGSSFSQRWLVIDTVGDPHDQRYAMHHGDPRRPHVIVPGRGGRCRYEFLLRDEEEDSQATQPVFATDLLRTHGAGAGSAEIIRCAVYTFNALIAERWRHGSVFLLGDAAHMMPPFAGQGLNSGLRDANNLAWKLACVLKGAAGNVLLDTYETERRAHAAAMIALSLRLGRVMMTTSPRRAFARDALAAAIMRLPRARRFLTEMRFKPEPRYDSGLVLGASPPLPLDGRMLPQPDVLLPDGRQLQLDELLGRGFALLAIDPDSGELANLREPLWGQLGARRVALWLADRLPSGPVPGASIAAGQADCTAGGGLGRYSGRVLLIRPDRFVAGSFSPAEERAFASGLAAALRGAGTPAPALARASLAKAWAKASR
ncbi:MAG TPA: bifunctional 3-(3-hydroxy-phenyl)propionate/3-hydroxycinnamic acid hydroxylase [Solirubrobacteraceae bacterium]|nr:bifunctional 3-(3-hydroxy-phenyl)propionate/3-hydroxycinnamic acid hydroxylase [Solirubrobacteraceae bacterium]